MIIAVGALCQGTVGFGLNLIAAPIVGLVVPGLLPAAMVAVGTPLSIAIALREREHIDWARRRLDLARAGAGHRDRGVVVVVVSVGRSGASSASW